MWMNKVFLVEDECLVREGLRDNIPWSEYGFEFSGEASDGEMALPLIRKQKPDLLITDIKMPFMDGLELCRLVTRELPGIRIIIISGYDDFEYAQQAIDLHVDRYMLKPITKQAMGEALDGIRETIEREREQKDYLEKFIRESRAYEQFERRRFFEEIISGKMQVGEIYERAAAQDIDISAEAYNIVLIMLGQGNKNPGYSEAAEKTEDELVGKLMNRREFLLFRWNLTGYAVIVKGEAGDMGVSLRTAEVIDLVSRICDGPGASTDAKPEWHVAAGEPVTRLSLLPGCYAKANHIISLRFLNPSEHILTEDVLKKNSAGDEGIKNIDNLDVGMVDPMVIRSFLGTGVLGELDDFVDGYFENIGNSLTSVMFRQYLLLSTRFNAAIMAKSFGCSQDEFLASIPDITGDMNPAQAKDYIKNVLQSAIMLRELRSSGLNRSLIKKAVEYIDANFDNETISLSSVAREVNVSANYFSALFSEEMGETFIEYVTDKRIEKAKQLLRSTTKRSGEIAFEVGYRDPRYFSFLFKKMQGCTPRDYRAGK